MNKRMLTSILGVFVLALLFVTTPVLAAEVDVTSANESTGANSDNHNNANIDNDGNVDIENDADVNNVATATANTGDNEENMNTKGGDTTSGDIDASTDWDSMVNDGFGLCGCPFGDEDSSYSADFLNRLTGYDSDNTNTLDVDNNGDVSIDNNADIANVLSLWANTGKNESNMNTEGGDIDTGDVDVAANATNVANTADGSGSSSGHSSTVDVTASNESTGASSDNHNTVKIDNSGDVDVNNDANITNTTTVTANTGGNESNKNTKGGSIDTGNVDVQTDIVNVANTGVCCPGSKGVDVKADLSNNMTGYDSDNTNTVKVNNDGDVSVDNNADISNVLSVNATTGNNESNKNTEGGSTDTGSISVHFGSSTTANSAE